MHGTLDRQYPITTIQPYRRPCLGRLSQVLLIIYWLMPTLIRNTVWWRKQGIPVWPYMHLTFPRSRAMIPPSIFLVSRFVQATFTQNIMIVDAGTSPSFQVLSIGSFLALREHPLSQKISFSYSLREDDNHPMR